MKLTYAGMFYESITPKYFLQAFKMLSVERPDIAANIELEFIGHLRKENKKLITELGLDEYIRDHGYLDHKETVRRIKKSDVLWVMVGKSRNADTITPGKLFEYFGTGRPILGCVVDGSAKTALQEYKASFITDPYNLEEIRDTLIRINDLYKNKMLPEPDNDFIEKHNRITLTEQLTKAFQFYLKAE